MEKLWTVLDIINWTVDYLNRKNIEEAGYKTELLLADVLGLKRFDLYLNFDRPLSQKERNDFKEYLNRLVNNEPVQYILGKWNFYGYDFKVTNDVLIPRRETEELTEKALKYLLKSNLNERFNIVDVGTGSGAIIISLYLELKNKLKRDVFEKIIFTATDISQKALEIADENARINIGDTHGIKFLKSDLLTEINQEIDLLISNPPYVSLNDYNKLSKELYFEPKNAITDNGDGLYFYRKLISEVKKRRIKKAFFEIGYNQKKDIEEICLGNNISDFKFFKDLSGKYRILEISNF